MARPAAFLSYAHRDDSYHSGAISKLCKELSGAISMAIGNDFEIFQDRKNIAWGDHWPSELEKGLAGSRFLIAILSPSFFNSDYCRKELAEFLEIEKATGRNDLILPIYYVPTPHIENPLKRDADPLAKAISQRQYADWRDLRHLPFSEPKVRRKLDSLAQELVLSLERSGPQETEIEEKSEAFAMPFADTADTFATGAFEDPEEFAHRARDTGLMEAPSTAFISNLNDNPPEPGTGFRDIDAAWCPEMMAIPEGSFVMGSPPDEEEREEYEEPEHRVHFAKPFAIGVHPVTFNEFDHFCIETGRRKPDRSDWGRGRRPVINVNVEEADAYLIWLSKVTGKSYSLPSEAMWEYTCRAGTATPFSTGAKITTDQANYDGNFPYGAGKKGKYREQTLEVGSFSANSFGLFDMHGNVWEWCIDHWHDTYDDAPRDGTAWLDGGDASKRVLRGGSWTDNARDLRSACRYAYEAGYRSSGIGFRCARVQESSR